MRKVLQMLAVLDDSDLEWLATNGARRYVPSGTELIRENNPIESLLIVLDGELVVCLREAGGKEIARLRSGEVVGELSFVDTQPPVATVFAAIDSWVLALPRDVLSAGLAKDTGFAARWYRSIAICLADRLRTSVRRLGYGEAAQDVMAEELGDSTLDNISLAAVRFDKMMRKLQGEKAA